jgi:FAD/FMN-containing dehydrogenase
MSDFASKLASKLGSGAVLTDPADMAKYVRSWSGSETGRALCVVRPANTGEVSKAMAAAYAEGIAVVPQSGNTGLAGGSIPDGSGRAIVLSLERMNKIREISASALTMTVEAGCILAKLHETVEAQGLFFPLNFGAKGSCMIGGNLATNAGGSNVVRYGNTRELCLGIEVVLPDGRVMDLLSGLRKNNTGYDLRDLFVGSEGTLGIITAATMKLYPLPKVRATSIVAVESLADALKVLNRVQAESGGAVEAFEMMPDAFLRQAQRHKPDLLRPFSDLPRYAAMIEIAATSDVDATPDADGVIPVAAVLQRACEAALEDGLIQDALFAASEAQRLEIWKLREAALEVTNSVKTKIGFDISLPLERIHDFVAETQAMVDRTVTGASLDPLGHLGDGNLHLGIWCEPDADAQAFQAKAQQMKDAVLDLLVKNGGSFSAEHGIGSHKLGEMRKYKDAVALDVMRAIKAALDPKNMMNPGRTIPAGN